MKNRQELENSVKTVQALSASNLKAGAQILMLHTNPQFSDEPFKELYNNIREQMTSSQDKIEEYIESLKKIRIECQSSDESKSYVIEQAEQMVEMEAHRDFAKSYMSKEKDTSFSKD